MGLAERLPLEWRWARTRRTGRMPLAAFEVAEFCHFGSVLSVEGSSLWVDCRLEFCTRREGAMPSLDWIGKNAVLNHHREVPYHLLKCDKDLSEGDPGSGNLLVEGDNLLALKALLPYYAGKVKCIYIDPPYNTGNENWVYNDNVNSPEIRQWLGKVVGAEAEDLSRLDRGRLCHLPTCIRNRCALTFILLLLAGDSDSSHSLRSTWTLLFLALNPSGLYSNTTSRHLAIVLSA